MIVAELTYLKHNLLDFTAFSVIHFLILDFGKFFSSLL
jgi:hypothetical protein